MYINLKSDGLLGEIKMIPLGWGKRKHKPSNDNDKGHGDFRPLVTGGGWHALEDGIKDRFDVMAEHPVLTRYDGEMVVKRSWVGWCFAQICKLFGTPLAPYAGNDVPVSVNVFPVENGGMCWQRIYDFENNGKMSVQSIKIVDDKQGLLECVGGGLGMRLNVYEKDGILHFKSKKYFIKIKDFYIPLPFLITPGELHVEHIDEVEGFFRFRLSFDHPIFGQTFYQDGLFIEEEKKDE